MHFDVGNGKREEMEKDCDCDVGPWGEWTSCFLPNDMCGVGSKDRSRYTFVFIKVYIVVKYEGEIAQALKVKVLILVFLGNRLQKRNTRARNVQNPGLSN